MIAFVFGIVLGLIIGLLINRDKADIPKEKEKIITYVDGGMCAKCGRRPKRFDNLCMTCDDARYGY